MSQQSATKCGVNYVVVMLNISIFKVVLNHLSAAVTADCDQINGRKW